MLRVMLDSDRPDLADAGAELFATYSDLITDQSAYEAKHPGVIIVYIDRKLGDPGGKASVIDIEPGAWDVAAAPKWCSDKIAAGVKDVTCYVDRAELAALDGALGTIDVYRWIATLDGTVDPAGFKPLHAPAAVQCLPAADLGIHADLSIVIEPQWHRAAGPAWLAGAKTELNAIDGDAAQIHNRAADLLKVLGQLG